MRAGVVAGAVLLGMAGMALGADIAAVRAADPQHFERAAHPKRSICRPAVRGCDLERCLGLHADDPGMGLEGQQGQRHVVATVSRDQGKTWSELAAIEPDSGPEARG